MWNQWNLNGDKNKNRIVSGILLKHKSVLFLKKNLKSVWQCITPWNSHFTIFLYKMFFWTFFFLCSWRQTQRNVPQQMTPGIVPRRWRNQKRILTALAMAGANGRAAPPRVLLRMWRRQGRKALWLFRRLVPGGEACLPTAGPPLGRKLEQVHSRLLVGLSLPPALPSPLNLGFPFGLCFH